jgi:hypothetical protein
MIAVAPVPAPAAEVTHQVLAWLASEVIEHREGRIGACGECARASAACPAHAGDQAVADTMHALAEELGSTGADVEAVLVLWAFSPRIAAAIAEPGGKPVLAVVAGS